MPDSAECVLGSSMLCETILHSFLWLNSNYSDNLEKERNNSAHLHSNPPLRKVNSDGVNGSKVGSVSIIGFRMVSIKYSHEHNLSLKVGFLLHPVACFLHNVNNLCSFLVLLLKPSWLTVA